MVCSAGVAAACKGFAASKSVSLSSWPRGGRLEKSARRRDKWGPDMAPQTPQGSEHRGEAVALLDTPTGSSLAGVVPGRLGRREGCPHVLGPDTDPDEPGGNPPQEGEARLEAPQNHR